MKFKEIPPHGWILYLTIIIYFWISIAAMIKDVFL